jgi:hypothetical protein
MLIGTIMTMFNIEMIEELKGAITKERAIMSSSGNGALMSIQSLPTLRTKGRSLNSATKSWTLLIKNLLSRTLACL